MSLLPSPICLNRERRLLAPKLMLLIRPPLCVGSEVTLLPELDLYCCLAEANRF